MAIVENLIVLGAQVVSLLGPHTPDAIAHRAAEGFIKNHGPQIAEQGHHFEDGTVVSPWYSVTEWEGGAVPPNTLYANLMVRTETPNNSGPVTIRAIWPNPNTVDPSSPKLSPEVYLTQAAISGTNISAMLGVEVGGASMSDGCSSWAILFSLPGTSLSSSDCYQGYTTPITAKLTIDGQPDPIDVNFSSVDELGNRAIYTTAFYRTTKLANTYERLTAGLDEKTVNGKNVKATFVPAPGSAFVLPKEVLDEIVAHKLKYAPVPTPLPTATLAPTERVSSPNNLFLPAQQVEAPNDNVVTKNEVSPPLQSLGIDIVTGPGGEVFTQNPKTDFRSGAEINELDVIIQQPSTTYDDVTKLLDKISELRNPFWLKWFGEDGTMKRHFGTELGTVNFREVDLIIANPADQTRLLIVGKGPDGSWLALKTGTGDPDQIKSILATNASGGPDNEAAEFVRTVIENAMQGSSTRVMTGPASTRQYLKGATTLGNLVNKRARLVGQDQSVPLAPVSVLDNNNNPFPAHLLHPVTGVFSKMSLVNGQPAAIYSVSSRDVTVDDGGLNDDGFAFDTPEFVGNTMPQFVVVGNTGEIFVIPNFSLIPPPVPTATPQSYIFPDNSPISFNLPTHLGDMGTFVSLSVSAPLITPRPIDPDQNPMYRMNARRHAIMAANNL